MIGEVRRYNFQTCWWSTHIGIHAFCLQTSLLPHTWGIWACSRNLSHWNSRKNQQTSSQKCHLFLFSSPAGILLFTPDQCEPKTNHYSLTLSHSIHFCPRDFSALSSSENFRTYQSSRLLSTMLYIHLRLCNHDQGQVQLTWYSMIHHESLKHTLGYFFEHSSKFFPKFYLWID